MNKTLLIGHLGRDVELRYSQSGIAIANVSLATNENWTDKATGERREKTEWHRLVAFGRKAEIMAEYLRKGSQVFIEGRLRTRQYEKDGITRYITEVEVTDVKFLDSNRGTSTSAAGAPTQGTSQVNTPNLF